MKTGLQRIERFRHGLETAFPFPEVWAVNVPDETLVCRCEEVTAGDIRRTVQEGHWEINRVKAMCRVGMGRCQGRMCGLAAAEIVAHESGRPIEQVGVRRPSSPFRSASSHTRWSSYHERAD